MNITTNGNEYELEYYDKILEFFQNRDNNMETAEIWRSKTIIELMKVLERTKNREMVKNALLLIISLYQELPPDGYNDRGVNSDSLDDEQKALFLSELKSEFESELPN